MKFEFRGKSPTKLRLFGERNSGTNFIEALLLKNFPDLELFREYPFEKHAFFNEAYTTPNMVCVCVTRSADMWLKSTYRSKHQIWAWARSTSFSQFLQHEWYSHFSGHLLQKRSKALGLRRGHELLLDRHPITGARIENVLALRSLKLASYYKVPRMHKNFAFVQYEDASADQIDFLKRFGAAFNLTGIEPPQKIENNLSRNVMVRTRRPDELAEYTDFSAADLEFVFANLDFDIERDFGYEYTDDFQPRSEPALDNARA